MIPICSPAVVTAIAGYYARRGQGAAFSASILFNYRLSRRLSGNSNRSGSTLLLGLAAWMQYGMIEEELWPFKPEFVDKDPPLSLLDRASARRQIECHRVDNGLTDTLTLLEEIRSLLDSGIPVTIEFPLHPIQLLESFSTGIVPILPSVESQARAHVVAVVGYDDHKFVGRGPADCQPSMGALLIRNSWGEQWADGGYGWLPYDYLHAGLARDIWAVIEKKWRE